jgi:hypothetical protein
LKYSTNVLDLTFLLDYRSERKFCSGSKLKEMSGSGIFADKGENGDSEASNPANKTSVRMYQVYRSLHRKYLLPRFLYIGDDIFCLVLVIFVACRNSDVWLLCTEF